MVWLAGSRRSIVTAGWALLLMSVSPWPLVAQFCTDTSVPNTFVEWIPGADLPGQVSNCSGNRFCYCPELAAGPFYEVLPPGCDGKVQSCTVRLNVPLRFPGNHSNPPDSVFSLARAKIFWFRAPNPAVCCFIGAGCPDCPNSLSVCGGVFGGGEIATDTGTTYLQISASCADAGTVAGTGTYSLNATACYGNGSSPADGCSVGCEKRLDVPGLNLTPAAIRRALGCSPRKDSCGDNLACTQCWPDVCGGVAVTGKGASCAVPESGPGARLRFAAGGAGGPNFPGTLAWNGMLGRYWSHDYAQRIVPDPDQSHVWLITPNATFREWSGLSGATGIYAARSPSDEKRTLSWLGAGQGWILRELDGTVHRFAASGLWTSTTDRNGNAKTATYSSGSLSRVDFPDGRREDFTYSGGRLSSITEVGVGGGASRTWSYSWSGLDLTEIQRPDGTRWRLRYDDPGLPGFLTRLTLVGTDGSERVEAAWAYDTSGNVIRSWKGDASFSGPNAVDTLSLTYTGIGRPTSSVVRDPLGRDTTYAFDYESGSDKARVTSISGDCPLCGLGPNATFQHTDTANPQLPTRQTDGKGHVTLFTYDGFGMTTSRTEASGTAEQRTTLWSYHPTYPAFVTQTELPSTSGGSAVRRTTWTYNAAGDPITETRTGAEAGGAFSLTTVMTYNAAGRMLTSDPPGYGTQDVTSYTYDPARGNLVPLSRIDPLVGTTTFGYDPYNRQTSMTDPNGVATETAYDLLNRVTSVTRRGATLGADLTTSYLYSSLQDLFRTVLPRGNVIENSYDAAGRLVSTERRPDAVQHGERSLYTLDAYGHRTREDLQRWDGAAWGTDSFTRFVYSSRCHLDQAIAADGAVTEYDYDCDGNLAAVWDANHPRASHPPTQTYQYDARDRLISVTQPWAGAGGGTAVTSYLYDVQDHLIRVTDAEGNPTTYDYSDRDLMTRELSPASGEILHAYNEHGEEISERDARGVLRIRTVDAFDRVTSLDYPDNSLDVSYAWDVGSFGLGRLGGITRDGQTVSYTYDRFGRVLQDGALTYAYDKNSNRTEIVYTTRVAAFASPVKALYTFDFADRESTLGLQEGAAALAPVVSSSLYRAFGPLHRLTLGNGVTETHLFDSRYFPSGISATRVASLLNWSYTTDHLGNPLTIADRTYGYQDNHYFLTRGDGPWGTRSWTYDRIGNRLSETRGGVTDAYAYQPGPAGNGPRLTHAGSDSYSYDAAGDQILKDGPASDLHFAYDDARQLSRLAPQSSGFPQTGLRYDGRGFLRQSLLEPLASQIQRQVEPTYTSEGRLLHHYSLADRPAPAVDLESDALILYFAGRPVLQLQRSLPPAPQRTFLDVDRTAFTWPYVEQLSLFGVTQGCGGGNYCGPNSVTRSQMAFFLLKAEHGPDYTPPPCTTQRFNDVPCSQFFSDYINQLAEEGITLGCGGGNYCPSGIVARSQMAAFLLRAVEQGTSYAPPTCTGLFADVPCSDPLAPWVEELARRGITSGCGSGLYCPLDPVTRGQMAIFLTRAFQLGWTYLTTDHLGTPVLAANRSARALWQGGYEPFGADWNGAEEKGIFLRFPGQWVDASWSGGTAYNVFRWYEPGTGRYTRPDPVSATMADQIRGRHSWFDIEKFSSFTYVQGNPLTFVDPLGLLKFKGCSSDQQVSISKAFKEYCAETGTLEFKNCMCEKPAIPGGLKRLCGDPNLVVRCEAREEGQCTAACAWSIPLGKTIRLCPGASEPICGPMGCTLLHELTHILGHGGEKWPDKVEKCLGCAK